MKKLQQMTSEKNEKLSVMKFKFETDYYITHMKLAITDLLYGKNSTSYQEQNQIFGVAFLSDSPGAWRLVTLC